MATLVTYCLGVLDDIIYDGELTMHPLYPPGTAQWQIEVSAATVSDRNGTILFQGSLPDYTARIHTFYPFTVLPPAVGNAIMNATKADCTDGCKGCEVPCDKLKDLPHVTFKLGGHNVTITGEDYAVKTDFQWPFCGYSVRCEVLIGPGSEEILPRKTIELGSSFLRGIYSAYDSDARAIYCESVV